MISGRATAWGLAVMLLNLCGCEKAMHDGYQQPKNKPLSESDFFRDGRSSRSLPVGAVAYSGGEVADASSGRMQRIPDAPAPGPVFPVGDGGKSIAVLSPAEAAEVKVPSNPLPMGRDLLERGQGRFNIYCAPCHSELGDGDGLVPRRGFPHPPSFHTERLRQAPDGHFYRVISQGYGAMYPYAGVIVPEDRWAIVAYIRALQFSQHVASNDLPAIDRQKLMESKP